MSLISKNQKGQTLIIILFMIVFALGIGLAASNRFLNSMRSFVSTDNASKARAIAEAAIERLLDYPNETLEDFIAFGNCGSECQLTITEPGGNVINAQVTLSYAGNSSDSYPVSLGIGEAGQVSLTGYESGSYVDICWNEEASVYASYIYEDGSEFKADSYAYNALSSPFSGNNFNSATSNHGYMSCFRINTVGTPRMIRLKPYFLETEVYVIPSPSNSIPIQGILIESEGFAGNEVKKVSVLKTEASTPAFFDYAIYQKSPTEPLSNRVD